MVRKSSHSPFRNTIEGLIAVMQNAGVDGGLIRCTDTDIVSTQTGNARLAKVLKTAQTARLDVRGLWALLPSCTDETPKPKDIFTSMMANSIGCVLSADLTDDDRENIFWRNGDKLLQRFDRYTPGAK